MDVKRNQLIETIVWVGIPMLFMIVDWVYKHVFNIEYLELSILLFVVATIYKTYQKLKQIANYDLFQTFQN